LDAAEFHNKLNISVYWWGLFSSYKKLPRRKGAKGRGPLHQNSASDHLANVAIVFSNPAMGMDINVYHRCFKQTDEHNLKILRWDFEV
jgi:hypothetical protein